MKKKTVKKLELSKETVQTLGSQEVKGGVEGSYSAQMRICNSHWHCGVSQDGFC